MKITKRGFSRIVFKEERGFTLVELITVVAIIAILAAVVTPSILKAIEGSRVVAAVSDIKVIKNAALVYYADTGQWPESPNSNGEGGGENNDPGGDPGFLADPAGEDDSTAGWNGPYLESWPRKNPWGGVYNLFIENEEEVYLKINEVPQGAFDKLREKLGEDNEFNTFDENNGEISISLTR